MVSLFAHHTIKNYNSCTWHQQSTGLWEGTPVLVFTIFLSSLKSKMDQWFHADTV